MWIKRLGFGLVLLIAGIVFLIQPMTSPDVRARADAPTVIPVTAPRAPNSPSNLYLPVIANTYAPTPLWRFGVGKARLSLLDYNPLEMMNMRFGWYSDWNATLNATRPYSIEYVPTVRLKQWKLQGGSTWTTFCVGCPYVQPYTYTVSPSLSEIQSIASAQPGMLWIIGNEMDRIDFSGGRQDEMIPEVYATAYHDVYNAIKGVDGTAQVAVGGVIQATPLRIQYIDQFWQKYQQLYGTTMPVDVWTIHGNVLPEKSCTVYPTDCWGAEIPAGLPNTIGMSYTVLDNKNFEIVKQHIVAMRTWMQANGQQNKPLIISEYTVIMPDWVYPGQFTPEQVRDSVLYPSFNYFLNTTSSTLGYANDGYRLVQRWMWYSLDADERSYQGSPPELLQNYNGNLFYSGLEDMPKGVSILGSYWRQYVQTLPAGASKPYAPVSQPITKLQPSTVPPRTPSSNPTPVDCADKDQIHLIYTDPSLPSAAIAGLIKQPVSTPKVVKEGTLCLPSK